MAAFDVKNFIIGVIMTIVGTILVFLLIGNLAPDITTAADNISGSGLPLAGLFGSSGIVLLIFMAGILISLVVAFLKGMHN